MQEKATNGHVTDSGDVKPEGLTTVPPDQFLTAKKNVAVCFVCTNHGILPPRKVNCKLHKF